MINFVKRAFHTHAAPFQEIPTQNYRSPLNDVFGESFPTSWRATPLNDVFRQAGRSMIEMLGVLAIIGVLSVGGIASFQKAMFKYKLNKQAEQINSLMDALVKLDDRGQWDENQNPFPFLIALREDEFY